MSSQESQGISKECYEDDCGECIYDKCECLCHLSKAEQEAMTAGEYDLELFSPLSAEERLG